MRVGSLICALGMSLAWSEPAPAADFGSFASTVTLACRLPTTARAFGFNTYYDEQLTFTIVHGKKAVLDDAGTPMSVKYFGSDEITAVDATGRTIDYDPQTGEVTAARYFLPGGEVVGLGHCNRVHKRIYK